jgi:hypothetical protein
VQLFKNSWSKDTRPYLELFNDPDQDRVRSDLITFFGPRTEPFLRVYEKMRAGSAQNRIFPMTWSWSVFFGAFIWFFYRKMYLVGAMMILIPVILSLLFGPTGGGGGLAGFAIIAKTLYVHAALIRILKADALGLAGVERNDYLRRAGGVSLVAGVLAGLLFAAIAAMAIVGVDSDRQAVP